MKFILLLPPKIPRPIAAAPLHQRPGPAEKEKRNLSFLSCRKRVSGSPKEKGEGGWEEGSAGKKNYWRGGTYSSLVLQGEVSTAGARKASFSTSGGNGFPLEGGRRERNKSNSIQPPIREEGGERAFSS